MFEGLLSDDPGERKEAINLLQSGADISANIDNLCGMMTKCDDSVVHHIANSLQNYFTTNPQEKFTHMDTMRSTLMELAEMDISDSTLRGSAVTIMMSLITPDLQTNSKMLDHWLPVLLKLMKTDSTAKHQASGVITTVAMQQPNLLRNYVKEFIEVVEIGFTSLSTSLMNLYEYSPAAFDAKVDSLVEVYQKDPHYQSIFLSIFTKIASKSPELLRDKVDIFMEQVYNPSLGAQVLMMLTDIASKFPDDFSAHFDTIVDATRLNSNALYGGINLLGQLSHTSKEQAGKALDFFFEMFGTTTDVMKPVVLSEIRNVGENHPDLLEKYIEEVRNLENDAQETIRDQARMIIDRYEGRDLRSLAASIDEQNEKIKNAAKSVDELMAYVDENVDMLKEFVGSIAKKLPIPVKFSTEGVIRKTIILHFICDKGADRCLFTEERAFTTETKDWGKWLKIAFSGIKLGKSIISPAAFSDAGKAVKAAYEAYKEKEDKDFLAYISQPFLTSAEQDSLIVQLREARFFEVFSYDAKLPGWICPMCKI